MNPAADPIFVAAEVEYRFERDRVGSAPTEGHRGPGRLRGALARPGARDTPELGVVRERMADRFAGRVADLPPIALVGPGWTWASAGSAEDAPTRLEADERHQLGRPRAAACAASDHPRRPRPAPGGGRSPAAAAPPAAR